MHGVEMLASPQIPGELDMSVNNQNQAGIEWVLLENFSGVSLNRPSKK